MGENPEHEEEDWKIAWAWDDANDKALDPEGVKRARREEMNYINDKKVLGEHE